MAVANGPSLDGPLRQVRPAGTLVAGLHEARIAAPDQGQTVTAQR